MSIERRRATRYPLIASAEVIELQTNTRFEARTSDLSIVGCYLDTRDSLPLGAKIRVQITHNEEAFTALGTVAYCLPNMGIGVRFTDVQLDQHDLLGRWLTALVGEHTKDSAQPFPLLVVDDSPVACKLVEQALPADEFGVLCATTGLEALELFAQHRPGLVITDWLMPDLSGIELCRRIRTRFADSFSYIILLTSLSEKDDIVKGLQAGADDYLSKPFDAAELLARANVGRKFVELHREIDGKNRFLEQLALTDVLTGLPNRRAIEQWATKQLSGALRHNFPFWVVLADLDQFKVVNDTYGHNAGDAVLKMFAEILRANTRRCDIAGRLGGDEFVMVITHTPEDGVKLAIDRVREQVEAQALNFGDHKVGITVSFGIAGLQRGPNPDFGRLLVQADVALHSAKRAGRNRVEAVPAEVTTRTS